MIATCRKNLGVELGPCERGGFWSDETQFELTVGRDYVVLGVGIFETNVSVLVRDDLEKPNWLPIGLFDISTGGIPSDWEFAVYEGLDASGGPTSHSWTVMWGYPQLVLDLSHTDQLLERHPDALAIFNERHQVESARSNR